MEQIMKYIPEGMSYRTLRLKRNRNISVCSAYLCILLRCRTLSGTSRKILDLNTEILYTLRLWY